MPQEVTIDISLSVCVDGSGDCWSWRVVGRVKPDGGTFTIARGQFYKTEAEAIEKADAFLAETIAGIKSMQRALTGIAAPESP